MRLPNGGILATTAGVINYTYTGVRGRITYYVPKDSILCQLITSSIAGNVTSNRIGRTDIPNNDYLLSANVPICENIQVDGSNILTNLVAPKAHTVIANDCALTAKSIGDILYQAYVDNRANVNYNFSGGTNANKQSIINYLGTQYGLADPEGDVLNYGGTIVLNP